MTGVQTSLFVAFVLGAVALIIGVTIGSLAGYYRGWVDMALMRLTDLVITLPVIVLGAVLGSLTSSCRCGSTRGPRWRPGCATTCRSCWPSRSAASCGPAWPDWCARSS